MSSIDRDMEYLRVSGIVLKTLDDSKLETTAKIALLELTKLEVIRQVAMRKG